MNKIVPSYYTYDSSDDSDDDFDVDAELDRVLLMNETTCDIHTRDTYLMKLYEFYNRKRDEVLAVCCQTLGLAIGIEMTYSFDKQAFEFSQGFKPLEAGGHKWSNVTEMLQSKAGTIKKALKEFPVEWNIIQMSREINPLSYCSTYDDIYRNNSTIYLSLLKYPHWEYNQCNPICIKIQPNREFNIYQSILDFIAEYSKLFEEIKEITSDKSTKLYRDLMISLVERIKKLINDMKTRLGPLVYLFQGKSKDSTNDDVFFKKLVKNFDKLLTNRQLILIFLFTRGCPDVPDINFIEFINPIEKSVLLQLNLFLSEYKHQNPVNLDCGRFPCIMIIDELLDQLPWEMILPSQEFTRIFSFSMLEKLHAKYKTQIRNGYLVKTLSTGNWIINPDGDLPSMEKRMVVFAKYFRPEWKTLVGKVPTNDECKELIKNCDVYIYSGHGSGLKYLRGRYLADLELDCVVFLFGCSSVALNSNGLNNSMIGPHVYYHLAQCPTIVGNIYTVTDYKMDLTTAIILTRLLAINNNSVDDFMTVNRKQWQNGKIEFSSKKKLEPEPNLTKLLSIIRCDAEISITMKSAIVIRGLPLCNDL